ncbi:uncharacterized protein LOC110808430 [Carica papaya]|uniref:uncharacterized protein LOC110808430 n=1 Tax=Carica papaya TaxID=3649 RepID=UPI000B8C789A|nr:uncharacterized protein LOC110808430 [Carica papaya]
MEGIIPMVYKAIRKNKTRRTYDSLSADVSRPINIADFYLNGGHTGYDYDDSTSSKDRIGRSFYAEAGNVVGTHKRHRSVGDFTTTDDLSYDAFPSLPHVERKQQLVRFGSHRMFCCVTGA